MMTTTTSYDGWVDRPLALPSPGGRLRALRDEIAHRGVAREPRPDAARRVRVSAPLARTCYLGYTRLEGRVPDVLDYAAWLFATDPGVGDAALDLVAIEREEGEEIALLLSKPLYGGTP